MTELTDEALRRSITDSLKDDAADALKHGGNIQSVSVISRFNDCRTEFFLTMVQCDRDGVPHGVITGAAAAVLGALYATVMSSCGSKEEQAQVVQTMGETYKSAMVSAAIASQPIEANGETVQ